MKNRLILAGCLIALGASFNGCEDKDVSLTGIKVQPTSLNFAMDDNAPQTITATAVPENASDKTFVWSSADPTVATVAGGVVTALKVGTTTVTVSNAAGNVKTDVAVTVVANKVPLEDILVEPNPFPATFVVGQKQQLTVTAVPTGATGQITYTYTSSNPEFATVSATGEVAGVAVGKTTISVSARDKKKEFEVNVVQGSGWTSVLVHPDSTFVSVPKYAALVNNRSNLEPNMLTGNRQKYIAKFKPEQVNSDSIVWKVSDEEILAVDDRGRVTALAAGTAKLWAEDEFGVVKSNEIEITVEDFVEYVKSLEPATFWEMNDPADPGKPTVGADEIDFHAATGSAYEVKESDGKKGVLTLDNPGHGNAGPVEPDGHSYAVCKHGLTVACNSEIPYGDANSGLRDETWNDPDSLLKIFAPVWENRIGTFTIMYDFKKTVVDEYNTIYQTASATVNYFTKGTWDSDASTFPLYNSFMATDAERGYPENNDADFQVSGSGNTGQNRMGWMGNGGDDVSAPKKAAIELGWCRIVAVIDQMRGIRWYLNGRLVNNQKNTYSSNFKGNDPLSDQAGLHPTPVYRQAGMCSNTLDVNGLILFDEWKAECKPIYIANLAFFPTQLTDEQVAKLGGFK